MKVLALLLAASTAYAGVAEDIAALTPGKWYQIVGSALTSAGEYETGGTGTGTIYSYSSGAYDPANNRYIHWGGGHADSNDNAIYAFDFDTFSWVRLFSHSTPTVMQECGHFADFICQAGCPDNGYLSDGKPISRHTYQTVVYDQTDNTLHGITARASAEVGDCWSNGAYYDTHDIYSITGGTWSTGTLPTYPEGGNYRVNSVADASGHIWSVGVDDSKTNKLYYWDGAAWSEKLTGLATSGTDKMAIALGGGVLVVVGNSKCVTIDVSNPASVSVLATTYSGDNGFVTSAVPGGIAYDSSAGVFVGWTGATGEELNVWTLTVSGASSVWAKVTGDGAGATPPTRSGTASLWNRWHYVPSRNVFAAHTAVGNAVYVYRYAALQVGMAGQRINGSIR